MELIKSTGVRRHALYVKKLEQISAYGHNTVIKGRAINSNENGKFEFNKSFYEITSPDCMFKDKTPAMAI